MHFLSSNVRRLVPVALVAALSLGATAPFMAGCRSEMDQTGRLSVGGSEEAARQMYQEAWMVVMQEYVDPSFNHQDWYRWKNHFQGRLNDPEDAYVAIETMVASLNDEYTRFLRPRDMKEQTMSIDSRLFGVGIQISQRDSKLVVMSTIEDTPAEAAGLQPKDIITHIDGLETTGLSVEQAADRIRGPKGTRVALTIKRDSKTFEKAIERAEIKLKSVFTKELDNPKIGYIRLSSFISESMLSELYEILNQMGNKQALILDVRGNYGGLFSNAIETADMFLDRGDIVSVVDRQETKRVYSAQPGVIFGKPVVMLIDGGSASASEILSGALKDNQRATLIGTHTFGKGLVQKINPLANGAGLNITISKYLTPKGRDINKTGIEPHIEVPFSEEDFLQQKDPQLDRAVQFLNKKYGLAS